MSFRVIRWLNKVIMVNSIVTVSSPSLSGERSGGAVVAKHSKVQTHRPVVSSLRSRVMSSAASSASDIASSCRAAKPYRCEPTVLGL
eukprot:477271-Prorocentrum_minimum.AAC.3